jgi:hypothetical protein
MHETFPMIPAGNGMAWLAGTVTVVLALVVTLLIWCAVAAKRVDFVVGDGILAIRGGPYGRTIALSDLDLERARVVDLAAEPDLRVRWKTNGAALPGLAMGWFRLKDKSKSLLFVTDRKRVLFVPTRLGWSLQLSTAEPERLLASLRRARA